jgi:threonine 3-dehydrogenase
MEVFIMLAVVKSDIKKGAELREVPVPTPGPGDVVVKVKAAAICGTDSHIYEWNAWAQNAGIKLPTIMGHEFSGEVVSIGEGVKNLKVGDYVAGETHIPCGECYQCRNGQQHICRNLKMFGVHTNGCFAEYVQIPEICAVKIPATIKPEIGAILEPLGTAMRASFEVMSSGSRIAVVGCGPIGLLAIASARAMGAATIIAVDVLNNKLELASSVGADVVINPMEKDAVKEVLALTDGVGVDAFIDASGSVPAISTAFKYLRKGGRAGLVGLPSRPLELDLVSDVVFKEATIIGIHGRRMYEHWTKMGSLLDRGLLNIEPVITHVISLKDFQKGFSLLEEGKASKVILVP